MRCPECKCWAIQTVDTRRKEYQTINKRVLMCKKCLYVFSSTETIDEINIAKKIVQNTDTYKQYQLELAENEKKRKKD